MFDVFLFTATVFAIQDASHVYISDEVSSPKLAETEPINGDAIYVLDTGEGGLKTTDCEETTAGVCLKGMFQWGSSLLQCRSELFDRLDTVTYYLVASYLGT